MSTKHAVLFFLFFFFGGWILVEKYEKIRSELHKGVGKNTYFFGDKLQ